MIKKRRKTKVIKKRRKTKVIKKREEKDQSDRVERTK